MARTAGIIAEYNPFHLGHQYHIEETRRLTGAEYIVIALSGDFVQRGEPALFEQSLRVRMALLGGADLVLGLPLPFATGSAEDFALGAVSLFNGLGCIDFLSFGSECGNALTLKEAAVILAEEPDAFLGPLKENLRRGFPYPKARMNALERCGLSEKCLSAIKEPNNLLGIEYLKAMIRQECSMEPVAVKRRGFGYHDLRLSSGPSRKDYASASAIRSALFQELPRIRNCPREFSTGTAPGFSTGTAPGFSIGTAPGPSWDLPENLLSSLPENLRPFYRPENLFPLFPDDFSSLLNFRILDGMEKGLDFGEFSDISPELNGRLKGQALSFGSFSGRALALKTRQYTYTRVSRGLLHILLNLRRDDMEIFRRTGCPYARILGFKRQSASLLKIIKEKGAIPLIPKAADAPRILSGDALKLWNADIYGAHIYLTVLRQIYGSFPAFPDKPENEYSRPLVIL